MIGRLMQLVQDPHLTPCLGGSRKHCITEMILRHHLRTAERKEDTTRLDLLERLIIQTGITLQRVMERTTVLGKGGRIENDQVILVASLFQILGSGHTGRQPVPDT